MDLESSRPTFSQVFDRLRTHGPAVVESSRGTAYRVSAEVRRGVEMIVGRPGSGQVRVHADCWGDALTCQGTRAGGLYGGDPSIYDWYHRSVLTGRQPGPTAVGLEALGDPPQPKSADSPGDRPAGLELEYQRIKRSHPTAVLRFAAWSALPPSVTRVFAAGTKRALVKSLIDLPVEELPGLDGEDDFRSWFGRQLEPLASVILTRNPPQTRPGIHPGYRWGHGTKVLSLYIRDVVLRSRYFGDESVTLISPWLCCPIDSIVLRHLRALSERPGVSSIREIASPETWWGLQDRLGVAAKAAGAPRVWLDDIWGDRE